MSSDAPSQAQDASRPSLGDLLARVEAAEGPDRELDGALMSLAYRQERKYIGCQCDCCFDGKHLDLVWSEIATGDWRTTARDGFELTASLDAALAMVERTGAAEGIDAAQLLHEALEHLANGGWRSDQPIAPQIANRLLIALVRRLQC